jgi:hypothetical protein
MKLVSRIKSTFPYRWLFPPRPLFRDRTAPSEKRDAPVVGPVGVLTGGIVLATLVLATSAAIRSSASMPTTDGRAFAEREAIVAEDASGHAVASMIDRKCAEHAREKLMVGLTNYYLQRRLRPGASSEDAADTSSMTGMLAGPGDPAAATPVSSCLG